MKDRDQVVSASLPGLAHAARVSLEECAEAVRRFTEADPWSRSKGSEGRRLEVVEGGWRVVNGEKYRDAMGYEERREYQRVKQAEYRAKRKGLPRVPAVKDGEGGFEGKGGCGS